MRFALALAFTAACGSFDASPSAAPDGGVGTDGGTPTPAKGCPDSPAPNTKCWDFDRGEAPGGVEKNGDLALDETTSFSPGRSLAAKTRSIPANDEAFAYLEQPVNKVPTTLSFDLRMRVPNQDNASIGEIRIVGDGRYYSLSLIADEGGLTAREAFLVANDAVRNAPRPLGGTSGEWQHVVVKLELTGIGAPGAKRRVEIAVDEVVVFEDADDDFLLETLTASQTLVRAGITSVSSFGTQSGAPRSMNVDDVRIAWTP